jgi:hypothetical protein
MRWRCFGLVPSLHIGAEHVSRLAEEVWVALLRVVGQGSRRLSPAFFFFNYNGFSPARVGAYQRQN